MKNSKYGILFTPLAKEDLDEIDLYISSNLQNPNAAERLLNRIEESVSKLSKFPYIAPNASDAYLSSKGYRKLVIENYLVFYLVDEIHGNVIIMHVIYAAREYQDLL